MFGRKKQTGERPAVPLVQTAPRDLGANRTLLRFRAQSRVERSLYSSLRESVPIIDAALGKIVRLIGSFSIVADDEAAQSSADSLLQNVKVNGSAQGLKAFVSAYLNSLLTYGEAVGEMLLCPDLSGVFALYNASPDDAVIVAGSSPMELVVCRSDTNGQTPVKNQALVLPALLDQKSGTVRGTSLLEGLPFVSSVLLRIFESLKTNWERVGDVRFAVTYDPKDGIFSEESARQIADEWKKAMRGDKVCDFVSVGNVSVKAIGAESRIPDCEIPVRVLLEQLIAKLGIPPFLLGISWSSTERMSAQQADILTSELEYYRAAVEPAIRRITETHLRLSGHPGGFKIVWDDINLQDTVELSQARLNNAHAAQIEHEYGLEDENEN